MRISDWSSDVCSSDLAIAGRAVVNRLPSMLRPLFLRRLVIGEGNEPLLVAANRLCEVGLLVFAAHHIIPDHKDHASQLDKLLSLAFAHAPDVERESAFSRGSRS